MGTNYYLMYPKCCACNKASEPRHIGKSSAGWAFSLHVYPEEGINNLRDWSREISNCLLHKGHIKDGYEQTVSPEELHSIITDRSHPKGILRHEIDEYCIGHGDGPYDYCVGDFS